MFHLPRLALGSVQRRFCVRPAVWALLAVLRKRGLHVQTFLPTACAADDVVSQSLTGQSARHLDSWLMTPRSCRQVYERWTSHADMALFHGSYDAGRALNSQGGSLDQLCDWLGLPRLVVVDSNGLHDCTLPSRLPRIDGIILDLVSGTERLHHLATSLESLWGAPVVAGLMDGPYRRSLNELMCCPCPAAKPLPSDSVSSQLSMWVDVDRLLTIAQSGAPWRPQGRREDQPTASAPLNIAVALDDAFDATSADTLEVLEAYGAQLHDFSPLLGDRLPAGTDVVFLGCGQIERYAQKLADNHCIHQALRDHVQQGGRIYAQCGGLAYLCREVALSRHRRLPMAGVLPATAVYQGDRVDPRPVEFAVRPDSWIATRLPKIRGYLDARWDIQPLAPVETFAVQRRHQFDLLAWRGIVGSRIHFHLAAQPALLSMFLQHDDRCLPSHDG